MTTPTIVASVDLTHQTGGISATQFMGLSSGLYSVVGYMVLSTAGSSDSTLIFNLNWDDGEAVNGTPPIGFAGQNARPGRYIEINESIYLAGSGTFTYQVTADGAGPPSYDLHYRVISL